MRELVRGKAGGRLEMAACEAVVSLRGPLSIRGELPHLPPSFPCPFHVPSLGGTREPP